MTGQRSELSMACRLAAFTPKETTRFVPETRHSRAVLIQAFFQATDGFGQSDAVPRGTWLKGMPPKSSISYRPGLRSPARHAPHRRCAARRWRLAIIKLEVLIDGPIPSRWRFAAAGASSLTLTRCRFAGQAVTGPWPSSRWCIPQPCCCAEGQTA